MTQNTIQYITPNDSIYPQQLRNIPDPPQKLYYRGDHTLLQSQKMFALVGSRKMSTYGKQLVSLFIPPLLVHTIVIVSGLALGTDAQAHKETLHNEGKTIAVLGSGIDDASIAPSSNIWLAYKIIASGGLLLSEYPPGTPGYPQHFPERNRIIAGLAQGVLVTEASIKSGALITAKLAAEYGKDVFVCPGTIFAPLSAGTNTLIKNGAFLVTHPNDILTELGYPEIHTATIIKTKVKQFAQQPEVQKLLTCFVKDAQQSMEELMQKTGLPQDKLLATLTQLECEGIITALGGTRYAFI